MVIPVAFRWILQWGLLIFQFLSLVSTRRFWSESKELYIAIKDALKDGELTKAEILCILKESRDVGEALVGIYQNLKVKE